MTFRPFRPKVEQPVHAIYFDGTLASANAITTETGGAIFLDQFNPDPNQPRIKIYSIEPGHPRFAYGGSWIVRVPHGDMQATYYPITGDQFARTFEPMTDPRDHE